MPTHFILIRFRYDIMFQCWKKNPEDRPSFTDLVRMFNDMLKDRGESGGEMYPLPSKVCVLAANYSKMETAAQDLFHYKTYTLPKERDMGILYINKYSINPPNYLWRFPTCRPMYVITAKVLIVVPLQ